MQIIVKEINKRVQSGEPFEFERYYMTSSWKLISSYSCFWIISFLLLLEILYIFLEHTIKTSGAGLIELSHFKHMWCQSSNHNMTPKLLELMDVKTNLTFLRSNDKSLYISRRKEKNTHDCSTKNQQPQRRRRYNQSD